jgi:hypothetical protein
MAQDTQDSPRAEAVATFGAPDELKAAAADVGGNTVSVDPGGATFPTIGAALASITDASQKKQYLLSVGPGTYNEQVTLKPWCFVQGAGRDQTTVSSPPQSQFWLRGTIVGASNSNIGGMTVASLGGSWGTWNTALLVGGCSPFYADDVALIADDQGNAGINGETVAVNWNSGTSAPSTVYISYSTITCQMENGQSVAQAAIFGGPANVELIETKVVAQGGSQQFGVTSINAAVVNLRDCYAQGATWALYLPDGQSTLIATDCQIQGPVSQGVQIINN